MAGVAAAARNGASTAIDQLQQFLGEPGFANAGFAGEDDGNWAAGCRSLPCGLKGVHFPGAADDLPRHLSVGRGTHCLLRC